MICLQQSNNPLNCLSPASFPISAPSLVLAKSRGQTKIKLKLPAKPPERRDLKKYFAFSTLGSTPWRRLLLIASLTLKLMAWVGKYLRTLAQFPLQREVNPSSATHRWKQLTIPVQGLSRSLGLFSWVWSKSLTLSIGAANVLAIAPEVPPKTKSLIILVEELFPLDEEGADPCTIQFIYSQNHKIHNKQQKKSQILQIKIYPSITSFLSINFQVQPSLVKEINEYHYCFPKQEFSFLCWKLQLSLFKWLFQEIYFTDQTHLENLPCFLRADSSTPIKPIDRVCHFGLWLLSFILLNPKTIGIILDWDVTFDFVCHPRPEHAATKVQNKNVIRTVVFEGFPPKSQIFFTSWRQIDPILLQTPLFEVSIRSFPILLAKLLNVISELVIIPFPELLLSLLKQNSCLFLIGIILDHEGAIDFRMKVSIFDALNQF